VVNHLIQHGKPTKDPKSKFWSGDNYALGVKKFAEGMTKFDSPKLPIILYECVIKPLMEKKLLSLEKLRFLPESVADVSSSKPYYCLFY